MADYVSPQVTCCDDGCALHSVLGRNPTDDRQEAPGNRPWTSKCSSPAYGGHAHWSIRYPGWRGWIPYCESYASPTDAQWELNTRPEQEQLDALQHEIEELKEKNETIEKEQEDLLVLLADNDVRIKKFKSILTTNNIPIPESEEESDEDDDDEI